MKVIIVESPTKAKTISKFLGDDYRVESSFGHIRDLPKSTLGIDIEHNYEPKYVIPTKARKVVTGLKKAVAKADQVILASDEDREGEAISWHLAAALNLKDPERIVFHEITKSAIEHALKTPRKLDLNLVDAQQARRILDRIVGYRLSPFLWKKVAKGLSAGRVQSVALRLIVDREKEIRAFKPENYWSIHATLKKDADEFEAQVVKIGSEVIQKLGIKTEVDAKKIETDLRGATYTVSNVEKKEMRRSPSPPFTTSTLQQESAKRLGYSAKKTMMLAQRLYESGHITYMRTDSVNLSEESLTKAKTWLTSELGDAYAAMAPRRYKTASALSQEAHEAIRPTNPGTGPEHNDLTDVQEAKVYALIWKRFLASQMPPAVFDNITATISAGNYTLRAHGSTIKFDGFLRIWPSKFEERLLPPLEEGDTPTLQKVEAIGHATEPPPRYSEASLIKTLEENGIGRPSTYAPTISVIMARNYVQKEARRFKPTEIGELVNNVLVENFPTIVDMTFTAEMEKKLDAIADGKNEWRKVIGDFYVPFEKLLEAKYEEVKNVYKPETTTEICEVCGKPMVVKFSRFGKFLACSGFPECKNKKSLAGPGQATPLIDPGMSCPECKEGTIKAKRVVRGRARGKIFWGCSRYPECKYASWENPNPAVLPIAPKEKEEEPKEEEIAKEEAAE